MSPDLARLLGWAATLQNLTVTALVAWILAILIATQGLPSSHPHFDQSPPLSLTVHLGFVGAPTAMAPPPAVSASGSAAVLPRDRPA